MIPRNRSGRLGILILLPFFLFMPRFRASADTLGEHHTFFVNEKYDVSGRSSMPVTLDYVGDHAYYYVDDEYINSLDSASRSQVTQQLSVLSNEFDSNIYPKETALWGSEPNPGIDGDSHITIILEELKAGTGGDFDSVNEYPRSEAPNSNQREILTANITSLGTDSVKTFLAHEMQHLISFNQKELLHNVDEDVWLNELRSQYAITAAGYNSDFPNSDLFQRAQAFIRNPTDSMMEWPNVNQDYASVTLFGQYMTEQYSPGILSDTLKSPLTGIASINDWLVSHHYAERFTDIFGRWELADILNNTSLDPRDGYIDPNLRGLHVAQTDIEAFRSLASASFTYSLKPWQPAWYQYFLPASSVAGQALQLKWIAPGFSVLYYDSRGTTETVASPVVINHPENLSWVVLMPINAAKTSGFGASETPAPLTLNFSFINQPQAVTTIGPGASAPAATIADGSLIGAPGESDAYVVTGAYKRFMTPAALKLYGLDTVAMTAVSIEQFNHYTTSNYIRAIDDKKVYAVWPDGTKHWLNISAQTFSASGRDWNSIFIVNDAERDLYKTDADITH